MKTTFFLAIIISLALMAQYPAIFIPVLLVGLTIAYIIIKRAKSRIEKREEEISQSINEATSLYEKLRSKIEMPTETRMVYYQEGDVNILEGSMQMWVEEDALKLFPFIARINKPMDIKNQVYLLTIDIGDIESLFRDDRMEDRTILRYFYRGKEYRMKFSSRDYEVFRELIPDKSFASLKKEA